MFYVVLFVNSMGKASEYLACVSTDLTQERCLQVQYRDISSCSMSYYWCHSYCMLLSLLYFERNHNLECETTSRQSSLECEQLSIKQPRTAVYMPPNIIHLQYRSTTITRRSGVEILNKQLVCLPLKHLYVPSSQQLQSHLWQASHARVSTHLLSRLIDLRFPPIIPDSGAGHRRSVYPLAGVLQSRRPGQRRAYRERPVQSPAGFQARCVFYCKFQLFGLCRTPRVNFCTPVSQRRLSRHVHTATLLQGGKRVVTL